MKFIDLKIDEVVLLLFLGNRKYQYIAMPVWLSSWNDIEFA